MPAAQCWPRVDKPLVVPASYITGWPARSSRLTCRCTPLHTACSEVLGAKLNVRPICRAISRVISRTFTARSAAATPRVGRQVISY
ncbi:hypothetical protein D3C84_868960 [compost metagenome]